jgi:cell division protein FtsZ
MSGMGVAMMGTAMSEGNARAVDAAQNAIASPLLEDASINGARGVIINVTGGPDMSLMEVNEALTIIQEAAHEDANIIFGAVVDPDLAGRVKITVIATGFEHARSTRSTPAAAPGATPTDLQSYSAHAAAGKQGAAPPPVAAEPIPQPRLTIARRPPLDLPFVPRPNQAVLATGTSGREAAAGDADFDLNVELEVPAFLRRSEG